MSGWRIKVRTPDDPGDWTARGEGPIGTPYQYISGDVAVRLDFDDVPLAIGPPVGYWCCAFDWDNGWFQAGDCIGRTSGPDPEWERIPIAPLDVERLAVALDRAGLVRTSQGTNYQQEFAVVLAREYASLTDSTGDET